jgi:hypothetical protein
MKAWGQVEGRTLGVPGTGGAPRASRYGGVDWWPDCGEQAALERHAARGQRACRLCLEGERRREQERIEAETGRPMPDDIVRRQLAALTGPRSQVHYGRTRAACGTEGAKRRHGRWLETCEACGVKDGRSAARPRRPRVDA